MKAFTFVRPTTVEEAAKAAAVKGSVLKAGGIDLLDRMKERVDEPERVVALGDLKDEFRSISIQRNTDVTDYRIGGGVTLAEIAASDVLREAFPALTEAAGLAASPQIRARATIGGNLLQHTRCGYYRHASFPCFKRGDETCPVLADGAVQDTAAVFGNRPCASAHPSSLAPVLAALGASVQPRGPGEKGHTNLNVALGFYGPPTRGVGGDSLLPEGVVLHAIEIPRDNVRPSACAYEEVRQKAAFDWALVSACVRLDMDGDKIRDAGVWLGAVAPTPWRAEAAEKALVGKTLSDETIRAAAEAAVVGATPLPGNAYKVDLVKVVVRRALERLRSANK